MKKNQGKYQMKRVENCLQNNKTKFQINQLIHIVKKILGTSYNVGPKSSKI